MKKKTAIYLCAGVPLALGIVAFAVSRSQIQPTRRRNPAVVVRVEPVVLDSGILVDDEGIRLVDWTRWIGFSAGKEGAFARAIATGAKDAESILVHVLREALPQYAWPPHPGTPGFENWPTSVRTVATYLNLEPDPGAKRHLRLV